MTARRMVRIAGTLLALSLAAASPAASQIEPLFEGEPVVLPGIDVAAFGGPPWWTVSDADSTVYILASPGAAVDGWDTSLLEQRLKGARRLILQPDMKTGLRYALPLLNAISNVMVKGKSTRLETTSVNGPLLKSFRADRLKAGMPETRYGGLALDLAAFALAGDVYENLPYPELPGELVEQTATRIAQGLKVPVAPAISYGDTTWYGFLKTRVQDDCISATLQDLEQAPGRALAVNPRQITAMTDAWAQGDVGPLIAAYRDGSHRTTGITVHLDNKNGTAALTVATPLCQRQIPQFKQISDHWLTDETNAVVQALKTPGKTVVVYRAADLIFVGGVIDQLTRRGFVVKAPNPKDG